MLNKILKKKKEDTAPQMIPYSKDTAILAKFETVPQFSSIVEKSLEKIVQYDNDYILFPQTQFKELMDDISKYKNFEKLSIEQQKEIENLKHKIHSLENALDEEKISHNKTQENFKAEKNELLQKIEGLETEKKSLDEKIEGLNKEILEFQELVNKLTQERDESDEQLLQTEKELQDLNGKMFDVYFEYKKYENIFSKAKITMDKSIGSLNTTTSTLEMPQKKEIPKDFKLKIDLNYLFSYGSGDIVAGYLDYTDILNLRLVNKFINQAIITNPKYFLIIAVKIKVHSLSLRESYCAREKHFTELAAKIPDNYLKHTFSKYIWGKDTAGEYMTSTLEQCDDVYDQLLSIEDEEPVTQNKPITSQPKATEKKQSDSLLGKFFKKLDEVSGSQLPITKIEEDDLAAKKKRNSIVPQDEKLGYRSYYIQNPRCIYIPCDSYTNPNDKKNMMTKALNIADNMVQDLMNKKNIHPINRTMFFQLLNRFIKLLVYSHLLLQETKELECLKDYLVCKFEETKEKLSKSDKHLETYINSSEKERNLRIYYQKLMNDAESKCYQLQQKLDDVSQKYHQLEIEHSDQSFDIEYANKEKSELEKKVNLLAKEYKLLKAKHDELQDDYSMINAGFLSVKIAFENLNVD